MNKKESGKNGTTDRPNNAIFDKIDIFKMHDSFEKKIIGIDLTEKLLILIIWYKFEKRSRKNCKEESAQIFFFIKLIVLRGKTLNK